MTGRASRLLVIDASVVRAAGESEHPASSATRSFLESVLLICHRAAVTSEIAAEWRRHQSKLTRRWKLTMYARKKIVNIDVHKNPELRKRLTKGRTAQETAAILKDVHLIEAALAAERIVVSRDEIARALFRTRELGGITWVNPVSDQLRIRDWLEQGAPEVDEWKLGYRD